MSLPGIGNPLKGGQIDNSIWRTEWSYTDGSGAVLISQTGQKSDRDERVPVPVAFSATGITVVKFPKCQNAQVLGKNLSVGTPATGAGYRAHEVTDIDPAGGTCNVRFFDLDGTPTAADPTSGSIYTLILLLDGR